MNQVEGNAGFTSVPVDVDKLEEGYAIAVAMGGTDVGAVAKYLVTYDKATETITVVIGDVDGDNKVTSSDAGFIMGYTSGGGANAGGSYDIDTEITTINDTIVICGDVDGDGKVTSSDAGFIMGYTSGGGANAGGSYDIDEEITFDK